MKRPVVRWAVALGLLWTLLVVLPIPWLDADHYSAYAAGFQAFGIVIAFLVGAFAIYTDGRDRRVDRVYSLQQELTLGELDDARRRLYDHLKEHSGSGPPWRRYSPEELRGDPALNHYSGPHQDFTPRSDLGHLLRFFERARLVREAGSADDAVFVELIGRHACWWSCVIKNENRKSRKGLMELAVWADGFANKNKNRYDYLQDWGKTRMEDFGSLTPWALDPL
jgi:hypothetical protein